MNSTRHTPKEHLDDQEHDSTSQQANVGKVKNRMAMKMQGGNKGTARDGLYAKNKPGTYDK